MAADDAVQTETVRDGLVVEIDYVLRDENGRELDRSEAGDPLAYLHGAENIVPGLEKSLAGKRAGDTLQVRVSAADGYGEHDGQPARAVPRSAFPSRMRLQPEMQFELESDAGEVIPVWVSKVDTESVWCDTNHPLAGVNLVFDVTIVGLRAATPEELDHGHPHGPQGHHH
jgi:FKBP-type peptidyl-prolyl cis-trans isomerase SlyD